MRTAVAADWQRVLWWQARLSEARSRAAAEVAQRAREEEAQLRRCQVGPLGLPPYLPALMNGSGRKG